MAYLITTQVLENYGTWEEPYWKFKGGGEWIISGVDRVQDAIAYVQEQLGDGKMMKEFVREWRAVPSGFETDFERLQMQDFGEIRFPAQRRHDPYRDRQALEGFMVDSEN